MAEAAPGRLLFIDNLRWSAISMVVVMHAAVTYSPFGSWYFYDRTLTTRPLAIGLATYQTFQHAVSMGLLFGIAGYFARAALTRKGSAAFLRERLFRLGLPLLFYTLVIDPVIGRYIARNWHSAVPRSFAEDWWWHFTHGDMLHESGPLWFCLVLLLFSAIYAGVWSWTQPSQTIDQAGLPGPLAMLLTASLMAGLTFLVGLEVPESRTVLNVSLHDFPQYPLMFAIGAAAHRQQWLQRFTPGSGGRWLLVALFGGGIAWVLLITQGGALTGNLKAYGQGWHWQALGMDVWRSAMCLCLARGLVTFYRDHFNQQGALARFLSRNAFGVYVFHAPILIAITRILQSGLDDPLAKFLLASLLAIPATFLFVGLVVRRAPGLRAFV